jgi:O-antigen/teichoic acid export membrane protein
LKRKFIGNLALLLLLNLLIKPVYAFGIDVGIQNAVGSRTYGNYFILLNLTLIFQILLDLGIENFTRREIARHTNLLTRYFSHILPLKLILGLVYYVVCLLAGFALGFETHQMKLLAVMLFNQFLASFILYCRANLGGLHHFISDSIISVADRLFVILICGFLLLNPVTRQHFRIEWLVYAQTAAYLIAAAAAFSLVYSHAHPIRVRLNFKYYRSILRRSLPYALLFLLMASYLRIDSLLLGRLLPNGEEQAGIYAQSFRIIEILSNFGYLFTIILLPVFSRMIRNGEPVNELTRLSFTLMFVPALIMAFGCLSYRSDIINLLYNEHHGQSIQVFGVLIFTFLGICMTYIFGTLLTAKGSLSQLNTMAAMAVLINLSLNLLLIPSFGALGAAAASVTTQLFTSVYQVLLVKKIFSMKTDYPFILRVVLFTLLVAGAAMLMHGLPLNRAYSFVFYAVAGIVMALITGLLNLRSLWKMTASVLPLN